MDGPCICRDEINKYPQQCETAYLIPSIDATYTIKNGTAALGYSVTNHSLLQIDKHFGY